VRPRDPNRENKASKTLGWKTPAEGTKQVSKIYTTSQCCDNRLKALIRALQYVANKGTFEYGEE
jgi:hypothetical protein